MQSSLERVKGEQWASIQDLNIAASPQLAKIDDNLALTVGFKLKGGIRRNFVRPLWEKAYDEHDLGLRMAYRVDLSRRRAKVLPGAELKREKFVRRGVFFWTRNPELPYRVWATVATEFETILYPKTEEEAQRTRRNNSQDTRSQDRRAINHQRFKKEILAKEIREGDLNWQSMMG